VVHGEQHRACVKHGIACYLEKPPTLDPQELEAMITVETGARFATQVGFNYISQAWRQGLKRRVQAGEFGALRRVAFKGLWRRSQTYYARNRWAGKLVLGDAIVLDSCCGNAMAHYLHNLLFYAGTDGLMAWAAPKFVQAELYRANPIEGADTIFARGILEDDIEFSIAASHACEPTFTHAELIQCERAEIEIPQEGSFTIRHLDGRMESGSTDHRGLRDNLQEYCAYLAGNGKGIATTLQNCRPFVHLNALLYIAAGHIETVYPAHASLRRVADDVRDTFCIPGIEALCEQFIRTGQFPSQSDLPWGGLGAGATRDALHQLPQALEKIGNHQKRVICRS
jgi:predicted dehydrogenase